MTLHQYIERETLSIRTEDLYGDRVVSFLYSTVRENAPVLFRVVTGPRISRLLGFLSYRSFLTGKIPGNLRFLMKCGINWDECIEGRTRLNTPKRIFERRIRYWECRPMPRERDTVVSPADARVLVGSFSGEEALFIKGKFFTYEDLLGSHKRRWLQALEGGDFAVFRLTPDKYHYNHTPVAGRVVDFYALPGSYHSCNPSAVITMVTPYSLNKRVITVIDTDVPGGTQVGLVAMVEVVALMIGEVVQCYSEQEYETPWTMIPGMFLKKGCPKSLYRPGSSTDVLLFQKGRVRFAQDIIHNLSNDRAESRFSQWLGRSIVETDVKARSLIGTRR